MKTHSANLLNTFRFKEGANENALHAIFMFNFQVLGDFLGAKLKFRIMETYGDATVSLWAALIHLGLSQHFPPY
jgi:hypothetical protein